MGRKKQELSTVDSNENTQIGEYLRDNTYQKSNFLIAAKYQSTLLENKLLAISLAHANEFYEDKDENGKPNGIWVSKIKAQVIRNILGAKGGSFYTQLSKTANLMTTRNLGYVNPEKKTFDYITMVMRAKYENGEFYIYYNPYLKNYLKQLNKNYTEFNLKIMVKFKSDYSFRLYELIKSQCYYINKVPKKDNTYMISFGLAELMFDLGIIDADSNDVISILKNNKNPDYEKAALKAKTRKKVLSTNWYEFKRQVLNVAIKEINEDQDINMEISYDTIAKGKGGKITTVIFTAIVGRELLLDEQVIEEVRVLTDDEKEDFLDDIRDIIEEKIKIKDLKAIAEAANYNLAVIEEKYNLSKTQNIDNLVGWLISAIKEDYQKPVSTIKSNYNFEESNTVYDEELLLDN